MPDRRTEHKTTCWDDEVRGYPGTRWECTCGRGGAWGVRDGSAESDAHSHLLGSVPGYREEWDARMQAQREESERQQAERTERFKAAMAQRTQSEARPIHSHDCSCYFNPPCGACENCKHADHPECENDCQTCEEHDDDN